MAVYIGSKKIKELYYGGKKVKEAWYGSKKVYSSERFPAWKPDTSYSVGDVVAHKGEFYKCNYAHYTDPAWDEPGVGSIWTGYWDKVGDPETKTYPQWEYGKQYLEGSNVTYSVGGVAKNYRARTMHYASMDNKPDGRYGSITWIEV